MTMNHNTFNEAPPSDRGERALDRLKEIFQVDSIPAGLQVLAGSDNGIQDIYMNLNRNLQDGKLERKTKLLVAAGVASAVGSAGMTTFFSEAAKAAGRESKEVLEAIGAASTCAIYNGFFRFRHQIPDELQETYEQYKGTFNANAFVKTFLSQMEVEAICIAVSSLNNCHQCVSGHIQKAKGLGMTDDQIDELIRVAAVSAAAAQVDKALDPAG